MKERIYDEQIAPLMTAIIALCRQHDISVYATFDLSDDDDETLACTTYIRGAHPNPDFIANHDRLAQRARAESVAFPTPHQEPRG